MTSETRTKDGAVERGGCMWDKCSSLHWCVLLWLLLLLLLLLNAFTPHFDPSPLTFTFALLNENRLLGNAQDLVI